MFIELDAAGPEVTPEQVTDITARWQTGSPPGEVAAPGHPRRGDAQTSWYRIAPPRLPA
jgi:hypothetical protein